MTAVKKMPRGSFPFILICSCGAREVVTRRQAVKALRMINLDRLERYYPNDRSGGYEDWDCENCRKLPNEDDIFDGGDEEY